MSANAGSRLSRFGTSCLHRAPSVLAFCFAIAASTFTALAADVPRVTNETKPSAAAQKELDGLQKRYDLGKEFYDQGKYAEAEMEFRSALNIYQRVLGPEHPDTLKNRQQLATALASNGKFVEAEAEWQAVLSIRERLLAPNHPDVSECCYGLAVRLKNQKRISEALARSIREEVV